MPYIDKVDLLPTLDFAKPTGDSVKLAVNRLIWAFFNEYAEDSVTVKKWFFSVEVKVKHLRPLFVMLVGEPHDKAEL